MTDSDKPKSDDSSDEFLDELGNLLDDDLELSESHPTELSSDPELAAEESSDERSKPLSDFDLSDELFQPLDIPEESAAADDAEDSRLLDTVAFRDSDGSQKSPTPTMEDFQAIEASDMDGGRDDPLQITPSSIDETTRTTDLVEETIEFDSDEDDLITQFETVEFVELDDGESDATAIIEETAIGNFDDEEFATDQSDDVINASEADEVSPLDEPESWHAESDSLSFVEMTEDPAAEPINNLVDATEEMSDQIFDMPLLIEEELSAAAVDTPHMPFDMQPPATGSISVAPPVPKRRNLVADLAKVSLAVLLGAIVLQGGLWWGLGADPLGLSSLVPSSLKGILPSSLRPRNLALRPTTPPEPSAKISETGDFIPDPSPVQPLPAVAPDNEDLSEPTRNTDRVNATADPEQREITVDSDPVTTTPGLDPNSNDVSGDFEIGMDATNEQEPEITTEVSPADLDHDARFEPTEDRRPTATMPLTNTDDSEFTPTAEVDPKPSDHVQNGNDGEDLSTAPDPLRLDELIAEAPQTQTRPLGSPTFSRNELAAAIAAARDADKALTDARINRSEDLVKKAEQFYRSFAALAETATYANREGADEVLESTRSLISAFEFDDKKQRMIANATRNWMKANIGMGVFAAVSVTDVVPKGELFEVKATLLGKEATPLTLLTPIDPSRAERSRFVTGDRILLLGTIVQEPDRNIEGYSGAARTVIWFTDIVVAVP